MQGEYHLEEPAPAGTRVSIDIEVDGRPAVPARRCGAPSRATIKGVMAAWAGRFARNLLKHLGERRADPGPGGQRLRRLARRPRPARGRPRGRRGVLVGRRTPAASPGATSVEWRRCDVTDEAAVAGTPSADVEGVCYLVHSLNSRGFADRDRAGAESCATPCAGSGVRRIVYLSGLVPDEPAEELSRHISSRLEVEQVLAEAESASELRAVAPRRGRHRRRVDVVRGDPAARHAPAGAARAELARAPGAADRGHRRAARDGRGRSRTTT